MKQPSEWAMGKARQVAEETVFVVDNAAEVACIAYALDAAREEAINEGYNRGYDKGCADTRHALSQK